MSESPPSPDPRQATEAKLCAYLEDALSPAERAEIEQYLGNNPQHRRLLEQLRQTRDAVGALPHEPAPPEISEAFQNQLERSMLLDDLTGERAPRINAWPQRGLVAAIVLLAAGLGVVIYLALPGSSSSPQKLAINQEMTPAGSTALPATAPATTAPPSTAPAEPMAARQFALLVSPNVPASQPSAVAGAMAKAMQPATAPAQVAAAAFPPAIQDILSAHALALDRTAWIIFHSDDPSRTAGRIEEFFQTLAIRPQRVSVESATAVPQPTTAPALVPQTQPAPLAEQAFIARSLSVSDVEQLADLSGEPKTTFIPANATAAAGGGSPSVSKDWATVDSLAVATSQPATITAGQHLTITIDQLVGPGVNKTNTVQVAPDGTLTLPMMIDPLPAAGRTPSQLQQQIARRYRDANLIPAATVHVAPAPGPTTAANADLLPLSPATAPTAAPASQPVPHDQNGMASEPPPGTMDLVVLIQSPGPAHSTATGPSTQPSRP